LNQNRALEFRFDAFSLREPGSILDQVRKRFSLENAIGSFRGVIPVSTSADIDDREEGLVFQPKFDAAGLVTCVATDATNGDVLMVAHMNEEALRKTIESGEAWYFSRSRNALWRKGESSGHTQRVVEMRMDCDQDAVWIKVEQSGAACHTGRSSCFYRAVKGGEGGPGLSFVGAERLFDPAKVYRK
jgi:phosphoribosyl-AMP cyclohydrolase